MVLSVSSRNINSLCVFYSQETFKDKAFKLVEESTLAYNQCYTKKICLCQRNENTEQTDGKTSRERARDLTWNKFHMKEAMCFQIEQIYRMRRYGGKRTEIEMEGAIWKEQIRSNQASYKIHLRGFKKFNSFMVSYEWVAELSVSLSTVEHGIGLEFQLHFQAWISFLHSQMSIQWNETFPNLVRVSFSSSFN